MEDELRACEDARTERPEGRTPRGRAPRRPALPNASEAAWSSSMTKIGVHPETPSPTRPQERPETTGFGPYIPH